MRAAPVVWLAARSERQELARLRDLEAVVIRGRQAYIEVGEALDEIRRRRLYRFEFKTFAAYCETRWGFKRAHAYRQIAAARFAREMSPTGDKPVLQNERQARAAMEKVNLEEDSSTPRPSNRMPVTVAGVTVGTLVARVPEFEPLLRHAPKDRLVTVLGWDVPKTRARFEDAGADHTTQPAREGQATDVPALRPHAPARLTRDIPVPWSMDVLHDGLTVTVERELVPTHAGKYAHRYFEIGADGHRVIVRDDDLDASDFAMAPEADAHARSRAAELQGTGNGIPRCAEWAEVGDPALPPTVVTEERRGPDVSPVAFDANGNAVDMSPTLDTHAQDGPRRNQGGIIIVHERAAPRARGLVQGGKHKKE